MASEIEPHEDQQFSLERSNWNDPVATNSDRNHGDNTGQIPTVATRANFPLVPMTLFKKTVFQRTAIFSLTRLVIYLNKLYQDFGATYEYRDQNDYNFLAISIISLISPPILYALFLIGANLSKDDVVDEKEVSTRAVNGILLIPWQIKRHLDVLHFSAQRVCNWRSPNEDENQNLKQLQMSAEVLEFFEDFYAGFLQILLQTYIFLGTVDWFDSHKLRIKPRKLHEKIATILTNVVDKQKLETTIIKFGLSVGESKWVDECYELVNYVIGVVIGSILSLLSMMIAVRRRDDGKLTHLLSMLGWLSFISSRVLVFALVTTVIHSWMIVLCLIHVLIFSIWIYNIALESYGISSSSSNTTNAQWSSRRKRLSLAVLVFLFFGIPSLFIWPIMFQLKEGKRPLIFLLVSTIENLLLLGVWLIWLMANEGTHLNDSLVLFIIGIVAATLAGDFLLMMYVFCKPKYTDQVVLYEIQQSRNMDAPTLVRLDGTNHRASNAFQYGIFYEFCDIVFKLPSTHKIASRLEIIRQIEH